MKKILIFYASYGGGHLSAAKSLESCISENYKNIEVELIDCMKYVNKPIEKITTSAYKEMAKEMPWACGKIYSDSQKGPLAHISSRSNQVFAIKLLKILREKKPDLIISTHPFGSQMCSYLKRKGKIDSKIATIMTDFAPHDQWIVGNKYVDSYFVSNEKIKNYLVSKEIDDTKIFVTGIPISNRFSITFNKTEILDSLELSPNKKNILFFGGGEFGLGKSKTFEVFESLMNFTNTYQIIAISGKNQEMKKHFEEIAKDNINNGSVKILGFTDKVPELMSISSLVITKPGGLTISESLASSLPIVAINPIPGQEEENAEYLESKGVCIWIKKKNNPFEILEKLLSDEDTLFKMRENTKLISQKYSTKNICKILLS